MSTPPVPAHWRRGRRQVPPTATSAARNWTGAAANRSIPPSRKSTSRAIAPSGRAVGCRWRPGGPVLGRGASGQMGRVLKDARTWRRHSGRPVRGCQSGVSDAPHRAFVGRSYLLGAGSPVSLRRPALFGPSRHPRWSPEPSSGERRSSRSFLARGFSGPRRPARFDRPPRGPPALALLLVLRRAARHDPDLARPDTLPAANPGSPVRRNPRPVGAVDDPPPPRSPGFSAAHGPVQLRGRQGEMVSHHINPYQYGTGVLARRRSTCSAGHSGATRRRRTGRCSCRWTAR